MAQAIPYIALAVTAGGTAASIQQSRKATRAQEKADAVGRAVSEIANQREIRQNILRARALQAQAISSGQAAGVGFQSSPIQGAAGSVITQGGANQGFARTQIGANRAINELTSQARGYASNAQTFGAVAALPSQFGFDVGSIFKERANQSDVN